MTSRNGALRVLQVCDWHLKYATWLSRGLADEGHAVRLLTRHHDQEFGDVPGAMRAFVAGEGGEQVEHHALPGRVRSADAVPALARIARSLRAYDPQVVHFQETVGTDARLVLAAGLPWRRFALTVHDPTPHPGDHWPLNRRAGMHVLLRGAGVIFVHSEALRDELFGVVPRLGPVEVVPHGMAAPTVTPVPERPSLLFFGRIATYYKGLDVLLAAMPRVWAVRPDVTLTIAGSGELEADPVLDDPRVTVRNEHVADEELPRLFGSATCCVLPYRQASQSGVGAHAKAYGRAIVATDVGGLPELVSPAVGRLVPPGDAAALADALIEVVDTPGLAEAMGRAAAADVADAGWQQVARRTVEAYERHLLRRGA